MLLRRIIVLPIFAFALIAISNLILGEVFYFFLWLFVMLILSFIVFPIATDMDDRAIPMFQIFTSLFLLIFTLAAAAFYDFHQAGISLIESLLFGIAVGTMIVAFLIILKKK